MTEYNPQRNSAKNPFIEYFNNPCALYKTKELLPNFIISDNYLNY
jgi:hypothetical protein